MTACLLVRFVGVWDDVRTVLLLVVLMFLATSVTFDEVLARSPARGVACYLGRAAVRRRGERGDAAGDPPAPAAAVPRAVLPDPRPVLPLSRWRSRRCWIGRGARRCRWSLFGFSSVAGARLPHAVARRPPRPRLRARQRQSLGAGRGIPGRSSACSPSGSRRGRRCSAGRCTTSLTPRPSRTSSGPISSCRSAWLSASILLEIGLVERRRGVLRAALSVPAILLVLTLARSSSRAGRISGSWAGSSTGSAGPRST